MKFPEDFAKMNYVEKFPVLSRFFSCVFHVDWQGFHDTEDSAIKEDVYDTDAQTIFDTIKELDQFIALGLTNTELEKVIVNQFDAGYYPDGEYKDMNDWLRLIRDTMAKYAAEKTEQEKSKGE